MGAVIQFMGPLLYVLSMSSGISLLLGKKVDFIIPLSILGSAVTLYVLGLFGCLEFGYDLLYCISPIFLISGVVMLLRGDRRRNKVMDFVITPGLFAFIGFYIIVFFITMGREFTTWDEVSHWGLMVKETIRSGGLYAASPYVAVHRDYPPGIALVQCLWCKLSGGGVF